MLGISTDIVSSLKEVAECSFTVDGIKGSRVIPYCFTVILLLFISNNGSVTVIELQSVLGLFPSVCHFL